MNVQQFITLRFTVLFLIASLAFFPGCKKGNPDGRQDVSGMILMNGKPLEGSAQIFFSPLEGEDRTGGGSAQIMTGKYLLTGADGVKPGKYHVRISGNATYDKTTNAPATNTTLFENEYRVRIVPAEFNENSTLEFEVAKGKKNIFNYDIVTSTEPERVRGPQKRQVVD